MKKSKLIFLFILIFICCGCNNKYTLLYEDGKFVEKLEITDISKEEERLLVKYSDDSEYLKIDDNNYYKYTFDDNKKIYQYEMGEEFSKSPLINTCFDNVYIIEKDDYIHIKTEGEYYCSAYKINVSFKTDKEVIYNNASKVLDNVYTWDDLEDGIELQFSKVKNVSSENNIINKHVSSVYIRLVISIAFIIFVIFSIIFIKKKKQF